MIIKNMHTFGGLYWGYYEPEMEKAGTRSGAVDDRIQELIEGSSIALKWIGSSPMSPYTGRLRGVTIDISSYRGVSPGAIHYYAKVEEENNLIWNPKDKIWMASRDKFFLKGMVIENGNEFTEDEFTTEDEAIEWVKRILPIYFPGHKIYDHSGLMSEEEN